MAPAVGFEPTTNGLTVRCATAAPRRISRGRAYNSARPLCKPRPEKKRAGWRSEPESNRRWGICSPVPNHSAIGPHGACILRGAAMVKRPLPGV